MNSHNRKRIVSDGGYPAQQTTSGPLSRATSLNTDAEHPDEATLKRAVSGAKSCASLNKVGVENIESSKTNLSDALPEGEVLPEDKEVEFIGASTD